MQPSHLTPTRRIPPALVRLLPLLALLGFALFPLAWLGEISAPLGQVRDALFPGAIAHAAGHITIFFALGLALLHAFPTLRARPWLFAGIMLLAALGQEGFQLVYKQRPIVWDDLRDIGTDTVGAGLAFVVTIWWSRRRKAENS